MLEIQKRGTKKIKEAKGLEFYLNKHYPFIVYPAEEGGYVAEIEELVGCITQGETLEEVSQRIEDARHAWIETAYEDGVEIPLPRMEEEYSGKFIVRLPKYLHRRLAEQAIREGVSLNQYIVSLLSGRIVNDQKISEKAAQLVAELSELVRDYRKSKEVFQAAYRVSAWDFVREAPPPEVLETFEIPQKEMVAL